MQDHIKLKQSIRNSKVWNTPHLLKCFISLLQDANKKGDLITSYFELQAMCGCYDKKELDHQIRKLKALGEISIQKIIVAKENASTQKRLFVTIHHYKKYVIV